MLIFDAHLDLSLNALEYNRDLRLPIEQIRAAEAGMNDLAGRGRGTVSLPEMRRGSVGLCVATQLGGCMKPASPVGSWNSPPQAWAMTQAQRVWYEAMVQEGQMRHITDRTSLQQQLSEWSENSDTAPIGFILSLEGADSLRDLSDLHRAHQYGLRALGPAHYGQGRYAPGHDCDGELPACGVELLQEMHALDMILDVTHLSEQAFWQALRLYPGSLWASHHNCRALVDDPRQLSDDQILALIERETVIGIAMDMWMVVPNWKRGVTAHGDLPSAHLRDVANHIDHVCQLAGNCRHVGIGTDLDGGFGTEQTPADLDTIADLRRLITLLEDRGYSSDDIEAICHGNFVSFLRRHWD